MNTPSTSRPQASVDIRMVLESVARVLADCRERGVRGPDQIAAAIAVDLSNYDNIAGEFERAYGQYARVSCPDCRGELDLKDKRCVCGHITVSENLVEREF